MKKIFKDFWWRRAKRRLHKWMLRNVPGSDINMGVLAEVAKAYGYLAKRESCPDRLSASARDICTRAGYWWA